MLDDLSKDLVGALGVANATSLEKYVFNKVPSSLTATPLRFGKCSGFNRTLTLSMVGGIPAESHWSVCADASRTDGGRTGSTRCIVFGVASLRFDSSG